MTSPDGRVAVRTAVDVVGCTDMTFVSYDLGVNSIFLMLSRSRFNSAVSALTLIRAYVFYFMSQRTKMKIYESIQNVARNPS